MNERTLEWLFVWSGVFWVLLGALSTLTLLFVAPFAYVVGAKALEVLPHLAPLVLVFAFCVSGAWARERVYG